MRARLRTAWESRAPRERAIIAALALVLGAALYVWLVLSARRFVKRLLEPKRPRTG